MSSAAFDPAHAAVPAPAAADPASPVLPAEGAAASGQDPSRSGTELRRLSLILALGWLATNLGLQVGLLPLKFVLQEGLKLTPAVFAGFFAIGNASNYVKPLAGVMTDSIPLCGTRRRHYLLFSLLVTAVLWVALALVPRSYGWMLATYSVMYVGVVFTSTTLGGVMVEVGNHYRAAGRLTAQRVAMFKLAEILGNPLGGFLSSTPFILPTLLCGLIHLALIPFLMRQLPPDPPLTRTNSPWEEVARQGVVLVRSRTLLQAAGMIFLLAAAPGLNTALLYYQREVLHFSKQFIGNLLMLYAVGGVLATLLYYAACRRYSLKTLVVASIWAHALGALCYLGYRTPEAAMLITVLGGLTSTMAMLPVYDISLRATPRGSEAIGYAVMMSVWNLTYALSDVLGSWIFGMVHKQLGPLVWIDAATTLAVLAAVPFMPKALSTREDELVK